MKKMCVLAMALSVASVSAFAEDSSSTISATAPVAATAEPAQGVSNTAATREAKKSIVDALYLTYTGVFHGPTLTNMGSSRTTDRFGVQQPMTSSSKLYFDSEANAGYMLNKDVGVGVVVPFFYYPVNGQSASIGDMGVKVLDKHLYRNGGLNLYANLMLQGATSDSSQQRHMKVGFKSTPALTYNVPHSNFSVGTFNEIKYYLGVTKYQTFKFWTLPFVRYSLSDKFAFNVAYEMEWHHDVGERGYFSFGAYQTDIQPGFIYNITPRISINPYVAIFTMNNVSPDHTAVGAFINAPIL